MISRQAEAVYVAIPKCGSQAVYAWMRDHLGGERWGAQNEMAVPGFARTFYRFTVCRNPYARAVSLWWSTTQRDKSQDPYGFRGACPGPDDLGAFMRWIVELRQASRDGRPVPVAHDPLSRTQLEQIRQAMPLDREVRLEGLGAVLPTLPFVPDAVRDLGPVPIANQSAHQYMSPAHWLARFPDAVDAVKAWAFRDFCQFGYDPHVIPDREGAV